MRLSRFWGLRLGPTRLASIIEVAGIGLIFYGLWVIHPVAGIIGLGAFFILIAQGMQREGDK